MPEKDIRRVAGKDYPKVNTFTAASARRLSELTLTPPEMYPAEAAEYLDSDLVTGLDRRQVRQRRAKYGDNTETCPYVVRRAQVAALPPTTEWTHFEMTFEGDAVDAQALANYGYSMTIIFTSSKSGDTFEGAIGSTLLVDEVQITFEN